MATTKKIPVAPKNAKAGIAQSRALINKYASPSKPKTTTKAPAAKKAAPKQVVKNSKPAKSYVSASDPRYKKMTPAERSANTLKNIKESVSGSSKPKTPTKTPTKMSAIGTKAVGDLVKKNTPAKKEAPTKNKVQNLPEVTVSAKKPTTTSAPKQKTVSQLWKEKTGMDWSEAKKQGLTDGSLKANLALQARLKKGEDFSKKESAPVKEEKLSLPTVSAKEASQKMVDSREKKELAGMKKGGTVKNKRRY
jgi:hypothetical protein